MKSQLLFELSKKGVNSTYLWQYHWEFRERHPIIFKKIIEHNLAHFIATDAHNISSRGFTLQQAYETITKAYGIQRTFYFKENTEQLLKDKVLLVENP